MVTGLLRRRRLVIDCAALVAEISAREPRLPKRRFRIRQDGWVQHDGGDCPVPPKVRVQAWFRCSTPGAIYDEVADMIPEQWWRHQSGRWDVLWFRVIDQWPATPPPIEGSRC